MADSLQELLQTHASGTGNGTEKKDAVTETTSTATETAAPALTETTSTAEVKTEPSELSPFSKVNENWKTEDDVKKFISEHESLNKKYSELESAHKDYIKPANDYVKKLNEIALNNGDINLFQKTNSVDIDKLSPSEKVQLQLQWQKGLSSEKASFKVGRQYMVGATEKPLTDVQDGYDVMTDEQRQENIAYNENIKSAQIELDMDALEADKFLKGVQVKASEAPNIAKEDKERVTQWTPNVSKVLEEAGKLSSKLNVGTKDKPELIDFDFTLDTEQQKVMNQMLNDTIKNANGFTYNGESHTYAVDMVQKFAWGEFRNEIVNAISQKLDSHYEEKYRKLTGATVRDKSNVPINTEKKSATGQLVDSLM